MLPLKTTLFVNGISSGITGLGLVIFAPQAATLLGVAGATPIVRETGIFLVLFSILVIFAALNRRAGIVKLITTLDITWVLGSVLLIALAGSSLSAIGIAAIAMVACWVGLMAFLQRQGLKAVLN
ncbi:hypothetical protein [uncultured Chitinophaga sp.]|uniref:hypothetical protein n=1 Tax=uncultured Chitinophaga sp. TaxID=339340 RepID=UPI0025F101E9|nr:hypothetical protein [uncultured Chitinophaga sp.]